MWSQLCQQLFSSSNWGQIWHAEGHCCPRVLLQGKDLKQLSKKIRDVRNSHITFSLSCLCFLSQILISQ